MLGAKNFV